MGGGLRADRLDPGGTVYLIRTCFMNILNGICLKIIMTDELQTGTNNFAVI